MLKGSIGAYSTPHFTNGDSLAPLLDYMVEQELYL
jgi:hypothetical protein